MLQRKLSARALSILLGATLCFPVMAAERTSAKLKLAPHTALELQLGAGGAIRGKVVNRQGKALSYAKVKINNKRGQAAVAKTDGNGSFVVTGLNVGVYSIQIADQSRMMRAWSAKTAPPTASELALLVVGDTVRGQCGCDDACGGCDSCCAAPACDQAPSCCESSCGGCNSCCDGYGSVFGGGCGMFGNGALSSRPLLLGAGVAAAIAIPLAVDDDDAS